MTDLYPLALRLQGRRVLVAGGGSVATRRVPALLAAGALVRLVSPTLTPALRGLADAGRLEWTPRAFEPADLEGVWLIQVAVNDPGAAAEISRLAEERQIFCVRADDRFAASAWTPAVTRHGAVTVAVLAGGDPRRAAALRDRLAEFLGAGMPATPSAAVGRDSMAMTAGGGAMVGRDGSETAAGDGAAMMGRDGSETAAGDGAAMMGRDDAATAGRGGAERAAHADGGELDAAALRGAVALVGGGPGDPELITVKGRRLLAQADVVVADRLAPGMLLDELRPEVELIDVAKLPYGPAVAQDEINRLLVDRARRGLFVVRLKGGDPFVFGRGGEEMIACAEAGVAVTVVPGVTSAIAVPAVAGIPVTHRGITHEFTVVSGHLAPSDPDSLVNWPALAQMRGTLVILMGLRQLPSIVDVLLAHGKNPDTPAAVIQEGTTPNEQITRATLSTLPGDLRPPAIVVIGEVVRTI